MFFLNQATLDATSGLEISMDLSGEAKKAKIPEPWTWQVEIVGQAGGAKIWTSRHWRLKTESNAVKTPNLAGDSGRIVDFQEIYLKFIHSIINDILVLAWESFLASLVVLIHGLSQPKGGH